MNRNKYAVIPENFLASAKAEARKFIRNPIYFSEKRNGIPARADFGLWPKIGLAGMTVLLSLACPVYAGTAEVRYVAIENNCPPKKIDVYQQKIGDQAELTYRVECNLPKTTDETSKTADAILIRCRYNLCAFVRPDLSEKK